jgi:hypothetical protein
MVMGGGALGLSVLRDPSTSLRGCDFFDFSQEALLKEKDLSAPKMAKSQ